MGVLITETEFLFTNRWACESGNRFSPVFDGLFDFNS